MKPIGLVTLLAFCIVRPALAQSANVQGIEIVSHGIYAIDKASGQANASNQGMLANIRIAATTNVVPAEQGIDFGIQYKVTGTPSAAPVKLHEVVIYPAGGAHPPGKPPLASVAVDVTVPMGTAVRTDFYAFDEPWELIPGTWIFQVWYGNQKLTEQPFTVVKQ
jgi:hypothetical protein